jgi:hypothetical protein
VNCNKVSRSQVISIYPMKPFLGSVSPVADPVRLAESSDSSELSMIEPCRLIGCALANEPLFGRGGH